MIERDVTAFRPRLFGLAYRMLGTPADADDVVQEAFVRWQGTDRNVVRDPEAWLVRTATRVAIDRLRALKVERERYSGPWIPEPVVRDIRDDPERQVEVAEDISVAFLYVLERLGPDERAAFILHDVFDYPHAEVAEILDRSEEAVRQMVHRARTRMRAERPRFNVDRKKVARVVDRFVHAFEAGDESELRAVLALDVTHLADGGGEVAATREAVLGRGKVARLLAGLHAKFWGDNSFERVDVNGAPGLFVRDGEGNAIGIIAFTTDGDVIHNLHVVVAPGKLAHVLARGSATTDE